MATNPRIPDRHDLPTLREQKKKPGGSPMVPIGILIAAALLVAIIVWMPRAPKQISAPSAAKVPVQPTGQQVQITDVQLSPAPTGESMYVYATIFNAGMTSINGLQTQVTFKDQANHALPPVTSVAEDRDGKNLVDDPIPPNGTRQIRIPVQRMPEGWNHQLPEIQVNTVTAQGTK